MDITDTLVLVRGAGDTATAVGKRLFLAGFRVVMTELPEPLCIRRTVSFAEAVYDGKALVEGIEGRLAQFGELSRWPFEQAIPIIVDAEGNSIRALRPDVLIDARILKKNVDTRIDQAPMVGALGPGYTAGLDCHFVVETKRGHNLGRAIYQGSAEPDTGKPAPVMGYSNERTLYADQYGAFEALANIGQAVREGVVIGRIGETMLVSRVSGTVRGILRSGLKVQKGTKLADIDPRTCPEFCYTISDRSNAAAGGVLEGILALRRRLLQR
ncbi:MAG: EF2563 family selenium-dependent molybdenum hydroxylase system protein [Acidobacteria bacterium]|nr:EF2563 family selenium-dependent molybdenum hydroxylase system protein [Acidobacteriota bacterium]